MKICRFEPDRVGLVQGDAVYDITQLAREVERQRDPSLPGDPLIAQLEQLRSLIPADLDGLAKLDLGGINLLAPVARPGKIVAAPVNYQEHIQEMQENNVSPGHDIPEIGKAGLFLKAASSLVGPSQGIEIRFPERRTDHELELALVIGKTASEVEWEDALSYVAGYCIGLDITLRGREDRSFRKSIDSYSVLGPWLTTSDELPYPDALDLRLSVNGEERQQALTNQLIFDVRKIIQFASSFYTLHPGDVIYTGTPKGVAPIASGDVIEAQCPQLGLMRVRVRAHESAKARS